MQFCWNGKQTRSFLFPQEYGPAYEYRPGCFDMHITGINEWFPFEVGSKEMGG